MTLRDLKNDFRPELLFPSITAGLIAGIVTISLEISLAALIFSGDLDQFLAGGIGLMLFGAFVVGITVALTSSLPGMVGLPQDTPAAIMALVAGAIGVSMQGRRSAGNLLYDRCSHLTDIPSDCRLFSPARPVPSQWIRSLYSVSGRRRLSGRDRLSSQHGGLWSDGKCIQPERSSPVAGCAEVNSLGTRRNFCSHTSSSLKEMESLPDHTRRAAHRDRCSFMAIFGSPASLSARRPAAAGYWGRFPPEACTSL